MKKAFYFELIITSDVPCVTVVFIFSPAGKTAGRGRYFAVILATFASVGRTPSEVRVSSSTILPSSACKNWEYLHLVFVIN